MKILLIIASLLGLWSSVAAEEWIVSKTTTWSLLDRIAVVICEAERDDCHRDTRCGLHTAMHWTISCNAAYHPDPLVWQMQYRDRAKAMLEADKARVNP